VRGQFWHVVSRSGKGQLPWYRLPNEPIRTEEVDWHVVFYIRKTVAFEMTLRYTKSELGEDQPSAASRGLARVKLLLIATLAFAFPFSLLELYFQAVREHFLRLW